MRRRSIGTTSLVALAAAAAGLGLPSPGPAADTLVNGRPGAVYGGRSSQAHAMSLRLTRDGKRVRSWFVQVDADICTSSPTQGYSVPLHLPRNRSVRRRANGSFSEIGRGTATTEAGQKLDLALELKGTAGRAGATGTIRIFGPVSDADGNVVDNCDSGLVRWKLGRRTTYGGVTDDSTALSIRVDRDGRRIESFFIDLQFTCDSGTRSLSLTHLGIAVRRDGSFSKQRYSGIRIEIPGGGTASGQGSVRGKLGAHRAAGTYRAFGTVRGSDGSTSKCDTGVVHWTAWRG
jgi:hypothetical protein